MTKKILFLLTFLLTTLGGGNLALAESVIFNTTTSGNSTQTLDEISLSHTGSLQDNNLKIASGKTLTISTSSRFIQSIEMTLRSGDTYAPQYVTANVGSTAYDDTNKKYTWTGIAKSIVFKNANDKDARDFRIVSVEVTYTTTDPSLVNDETVQTYPYTWDFTSSSSLWETSLEELELFTAQWSDNVTAGDYRPTTARTTDWGFNISILKGLRFNPVSVSNSPCLDYNLKHLWIAAGTTITIPSVKVGQKIQLTGTVNISGKSSNLTQVTENSEYTVNANGDATLTFGDSWITTISVLKTDISAINAIGGTITTNYFDVSPWPCYVVFRNSSNGVLNMSADEWESCSLISSNTSVVTIAKGTVDSGNRGSFTVTPVGAGTSTVTISFPGSDRYNPQDGTIVFTINKHEQTLSFAESTKPINFGDDAPTNTLTQTPAVGGGEVSYSSSDTHVATVNAEGELSIKNSGTCIITATAAETTTYAQTSASYTLTVNATQPAPTITMTQNPGTQQAPIANGATVITTYGNTVTVQGTCSVSGPTVKYRSSNTSVATVDANGVVTTKGGGTTTITVYTETYQGYPAASVSYTLTVNATEFTLAFTPTSGKVNVGATITPQMTLPTLMLSDLLTVTASSDNTSVATVPSDLMEMDGGNYKYLVVNEGRVNRFLPIITGEAVGTAHITVNFTSNNYNSTAATYTVEVTADGTRNFSWADTTPTYTIYTGDFLMMPEISGNSNGNDSYSDGSKKKYVYHIKNGVTELNNKDYRRYEGVPDFMLVDGGTETTDGTHASVFWAQGSGGTYPDVLMVYGKSEGTVTLRAKDPQNPDLYCDATINIVNKSELASAVNTYVGSMSFPYTWDFTTDFDMSDITANSHYWVENGDHYYAGNAYFNLDYADEDIDGNTSERFFKYMDAGSTGAQMPLFYGMQVNIQGSSYYNTKIDRLAIKKYTSAGQPRLVVSGGTMQFKLPKAPNQPSSYRIYMKVKTQSNTKISVTGVSKTYAVESGAYTEGCQLTANSDAIVYFDVNSTASASEGTTLNFDNVNIYWIATSTEAKAVNKPASNINLTYAASSYAYNNALDLSKSEEANEGLEVYYASSFSTGSAESASPGSAVVLTRMTTDSKPVVEANTGLILKANNAFNSYMIAHAENAESPVTPSVFTGVGAATNYLVAGPGATVESSVGTGDATKTNFVISYAYKQFTEDGSAVSADYLYDRNWSFYKIIPSADVPSSSAYLSIPGNLYVNKDGQIVERATSARAAFGVESAADDDTAEAPASKLMLDIIFQETSNTATDDPATEDPESPLPPDVINGIDNVKTDEADSAVWHNMEGVRISQPTKPGLYIRNGKKVVIK